MFDDDCQSSDRPPVVNISSSRIQESYFDDEMQARVRRSSRNRHRQLSERASLRPSNQLVANDDELSNLDRAVIHTSRIVTRIKDFVKSKYHALMDYLYEEAPRATFGRANVNKVMQAPMDKSMIEDEDSIMQDVNIL